MNVRNADRGRQIPKHPTRIFGQTPEGPDTNSTATSKNGTFAVTTPSHIRSGPAREFQTYLISRRRLSSQDTSLSRSRATDSQRRTVTQQPPAASPSIAALWMRIGWRTRACSRRQHARGSIAAAVAVEIPKQVWWVGITMGDEVGCSVLGSVQRCSKK